MIKNNISNILRKLLCRLGIHSYDKYEQPYTFGYRSYQRKKCMYCCIIKTRCIGWSSNDKKIL